MHKTIKMSVNQTKTPLANTGPTGDLRQQWDHVVLAPINYFKKKANVSGGDESGFYYKVDDTGLVPVVVNDTEKANVSSGNESGFYYEVDDTGLVPVAANEVLRREKNDSIERDQDETSIIGAFPGTINDEIWERRTQTLLGLIRNDTFEAGYSTNAERFVLSLLAANPTQTREWLNSLFLKHFEDVDILVGILHIISHIEYERIFPEGQTIALSGLSHANLEVREYAIRAFENWEHPASLNILRNLKCPETWLQEYVNQIIRDLEEELAGNAVIGQEN